MRYGCRTYRRKLMGFLRDMYGTRSPEFVKGVCVGIFLYATWKDGNQVVGIHERPLEIVLSEVKEDLLENPKEFKDESWWF